MELKQLKKNWEEFAREDPLWAILTVPGKRGRRWDVAEFFRSGEIEIASVLQTAQKYGFAVRGGTALDFGCGVGRLTQALCLHFQRCFGVDIAPTMISEARKYNRYGERCTYILNDRGDLGVISDSFLDFIYSNIVLQHMRPEYSQSYLREFVRVLSPGGLLVFQLPSEMKTANLLATQAAGPLAKDAFRAAISVSSVTSELLPGQAMSVQLVVRNESDTPWPAASQRDGAYQLFVGNHWLSAGGKMMVYDDGRVALPHDIAPGQVFEVSLNCTAPVIAGDYLLEFDMGQEKVAWFKDHGSPTVQVSIKVVGSAGLLPRQPETAGHIPLSLRYPQMHAVASRAHLLPAWRWLKGRVPRLNGVSKARGPIMEMYGVRRQAVCDLVARSGGKVLRVEEDTCAGPSWNGYRYWVTKP